MFRLVLEAYFKIFFYKKIYYNRFTFLYNIFYWHHKQRNFFFLLYLIQFYTGLLSQSRHLQIEIGGWCG